MKKQNRIKGINFQIIILVLGAVFACSAPFLHILYPKRSAKFTFLEQQLDNKIITNETYDKEL